MTIPPRRPLTLRDVSEASGVSEMTVSRVLRNKGDVSEATRTKVRAAAKKLGTVLMSHPRHSYAISTRYFAEDPAARRRLHRKTQRRTWWSSGTLSEYLCSWRRRTSI